jgi:DNA-binding beta-propeller fold protein YncE
MMFVFAMFFGCAGQEIKKEAGPVIFYPALPQKPRVQFLKYIMIETDLAKKTTTFDEFLFGEEVKIRRIGRPIDIGSAKGKIYVADRLFKAILIIDLVKNEFVNMRTTGIGYISEPGGMWMTDDGIKYIVDMGRKQVLVYDALDQFVTAYGEREQFERPVDVAVHESRVYVSDLARNSVIVVDKNTGQTIQEIGELGKDEGQLYKPSYLAIDKEGNLFVTDGFNYRIQMFDSSGKYIKSFGFQGDKPGTFARPKGIAVDREDHLYAVDAAFENIQLFDIETKDLLLHFGQSTGAAGSMYLPAPVYVDYHNVDYFQKFADKDFKLKYVLIVGNLVGNKRVGVYGFGDWIGPILPGMEEKKDKKSEEF